MTTPALQVLGVLQQVVDLLTDEASGCAVAPAPCRVAVYPGIQVPWDSCESGCGGGDSDGQLWANLVSFTATGQGACQRITFTALVGIVRCEKGKLTDEGFPAAELTEADATQQAADADSIWRAFYCCENRPDALRDISLVNWTALGPSGGCVGGQWTMTGVLDVCC